MFQGFLWGAWFWGGSTASASPSLLQCSMCRDYLNVLWLQAWRLKEPLCSDEERMAWFKYHADTADSWITEAD